ncbi:hypothetical protein ACO1PK_09030 [Alishewanella sp. d11]
MKQQFGLSQRQYAELLVSLFILSFSLLAVVWDLAPKVLDQGFSDQQL